jgi:hypothetical protein
MSRASSRIANRLGAIRFQKNNRAFSNAGENDDNASILKLAFMLLCNTVIW